MKQETVSQTIRAILAAALLAGAWLAVPGGAPAFAAEVLSLEDCLEIAVANHPSLAGAEAQIAAQRGRVHQSVVADRLDVSGSASASRVGTRDDESASYSAGVTTSLKVYDANRNRYTVDSAQKTLGATESDARQTLLDVRSNVKSAYMTLLLDMEIVSARLESVRAFEQHLNQAKGFYEAGSKPWYDVTKAEVDLGNAQLNLVEAEANLRIAKSSLLNAMGIQDAVDFDVKPASLDLLPEAERNADSLALENRADYRAAELRVQAARATLSSEARADAPSVSLSGGYSGSGDDIFDLGQGWNAGIKVSIPIVDGGATKARVETASGQLASQEATAQKLRQDISLDVSRALSDLAKARERIRISEVTLMNAEENRRLAVGRYETGVGDPLEVTDALLSLTDAQLSARQAQNDLQTAIIALELAIGAEMDDLRDGTNR